MNNALFTSKTGLWETPWYVFLGGRGKQDD